MLNNGVPPIDRVPHPVDATRWLFVSFDYCHILKNWRNQWLDRISIFNGVEITAAPLRKLLDIQHKNLFQLAYKLTNKHLYPNNLERQKVQPAVDIFQPDITAALRTCTDMKLPGFDNIEETLRFLQLAGKWWNCHDVSSTTQYWRFNLPEKMPYYDSNDERLDFLCKDVPKMLEEIQQAAKTVRENKKAKSLEKKEQINLWAKLHQDMNSTEKERVKSANSRNERILEEREHELNTLRFTKETYQAILLTSRSTGACVRYMLDDVGFHFVLTRKFSSEKIESHFGAIRQLLGGNFKGDAVSVMYATEKIIRTGMAYSSIHENFILEKEKQKSYELIRANGNRKKETSTILSSLRESILEILNELNNVPSSSFYMFNN